MISINNHVMQNHLIVDQAFLDGMLGNTVRFTVFEDRLSSTEFRDGTEFKRLPLLTIKSTPMEVTLEKVTYDPILEEFTINSKFRTRSFTSVT